MASIRGQDERDLVVSFKRGEGIWVGGRLVNGSFLWVDGWTGAINWTCERPQGEVALAYFRGCIADFAYSWYDLGRRCCIPFGYVRL